MDYKKCTRASLELFLIVKNHCKMLVQDL